MLVATGMNGGVLLSSTLKSLGDGPYALVPVGGHDVEHFHLALHDDAIGLAVDELEIGPAAIDGVPVHGAVAVEPEEALVEHSLAKRLGRRLRAVAEQCPADDVGNPAVSFGRQVNAVEGQRRGALGSGRSLLVKTHGGREEFDRDGAAALRHLVDGR